MDEPIGSPLDAKSVADEGARPRRVDLSDLDRPLTKECVPDSSSGFFTETIRRASQAASDCTGGMAEAVGRGWRAYSDSLTNENIMRFSLSNGFLAGTIRGYAVFFDELAAASRRVLDTINQAPEPAATPVQQAKIPAEIDYDRLASLIARKIINEERKSGKHTRA
jgi:hypothetical protein